MVNKDVTITALVTTIIYPPLSSTQQEEMHVEFKTVTFADTLNAEGDRTIDIYTHRKRIVHPDHSGKHKEITR